MMPLRYMPRYFTYMLPRMLFDDAAAIRHYRHLCRCRYCFFAAAHFAAAAMPLVRLHAIDAAVFRCCAPFSLDAFCLPLLPGAFRQLFTC